VGDRRSGCHGQRQDFGMGHRRRTLFVFSYLDTLHIPASRPTLSPLSAGCECSLEGWAPRGVESDV